MRHFLLALGLISGPAAAESPLRDAVADLDLYPCELSLLSCTTLTVPLDHRANDPERTIEITFALSFASAESRGILFYFVGGPGGSGLASAETYLSSFDPSLAENMDIVFVDQRGVGPTNGLSCPRAQARFDNAPASLDDPDAILAAARTYVADCQKEMDADHLLPLVDTEQAILDFEFFRQMIGAPKVWLYGESYGTQIVQTYATRFPAAVRGVILDGVVDLNLTPEEFYRRYTLAAEAELDLTFALCDGIAACHHDLPDPAGAYDRLADRLAVADIPVSYVLTDGSRTQRTLTARILEANAFYALYSPEGRAEFLRALAAADRGNLLPMLQLGYANLSVDPESGLGMQDPAWYGAAFFGVTCTDYGSGNGPPDVRALRIVDEARAFASQSQRLLRSYFVERVACAYWPHQGPDTRPPPYTGGDWPTLILNGENDPITPVSMAYSVLDNARNAYGVFMKGGPHVIWGRGRACPDNIVHALLFDDKTPSAREQICEQPPIADYVPLTLTDPSQRADAFAVVRAVETELRSYIPLAMWNGERPGSFGCPLGGRFQASPADHGTDFVFTDCVFWHDLSISGTATDIAAGLPDDGLTLRLSLTGEHRGDLLYHHSTTDEAWRLSGTWDGQPAHLPRRP